MDIPYIFNRGQFCFDANKRKFFNSQREKYRYISDCRRGFSKKGARKKGCHFMKPRI